MPTETLRQAIQRVEQLHQPSYKDKLTHTFAVVTECTLPRRTRGTDFVVNLQLTDDSQEDEHGNYWLELIVFSSTVDDMPRARLGDIIELRGVAVQFWQPPTGGPRRAQLFGKMSQPHSFGFLLFHQAAPLSTDPHAALQPCQAYNAHILGGQSTAERLAALRALSARLGARPIAEVSQTYLRKVRDLDVPGQPGDRPEVVDMKVQVLAIDTREAAEEVVMWVWDATDAKPQPATDLQLPASCWKGQELRVARPRRRTLPLCPAPPALAVVAELPPLGTALPVVMDAAAVPPAGLPEVGQWVKIRVAGLMVVQGQMQLVFARCSNLSVLQAPPAGWQAWYAGRLAGSSSTSEWPREAANLVATCSRSDLQPASTIRQVQLRLLQGDTGPFRVQLRLVGYCPQDLRQWCMPVRRRAAAAGAAPAAAGAQQQQQQQWEWAAHLMLEDATGTLRALLVSHEATRLLGLPPTDLSSSADDVAQLRQIVEHLGSVNADGGAWMDVALTAVPIPSAAAGPQQQQQQQQQEEQQQQEQPGAEDIARRYRFIIHDAVCQHVMQQEAAAAQDRDREQPQQQQQQLAPHEQQQPAASRVVDAPSAKRQCVEPPLASAGAAGEQHLLAATPGPPQAPLLQQQQWRERAAAGCRV